MVNTMFVVSIDIMLHSLLFVDERTACNGRWY